MMEPRKAYSRNKTGKLGARGTTESRGAARQKKGHVWCTAWDGAGWWLGLTGGQREVWQESWCCGGSPQAPSGARAAAPEAPAWRGQQQAARASQRGARRSLCMHM